MKNGLHTLPNNVKNLPIILCSEEEQNEVIDIINNLLFIGKSTIETEKLENEIDKIIYKLYGLTENEIKIIESETI